MPDPTPASQAPASDDPVPEVTSDELVALRERGVAVLDVRNPAEWLEARVPDVVLIPLGELVDRVDEVPRNAAGEPLPVICATGNRSARAAAYLRGLGIDAVNVAGGTKGWIAAGHPVASGPG